MTSRQPSLTSLNTLKLSQRFQPDARTPELSTAAVVT
ncbi:hypothetical protein AZE42_07387 [Rhizopogon vesiculosus]|uniref:Uncharacterized protein n=1 Tax=Rhizopogon vesiculosus TaxID=180088 RepID=A0A1J8QDW5_9AGAM|nr:hypothetical protein AZE42_07387 [Rhizopogon vesiculosus]